MDNLNSYRTILLILAGLILLVGAADALSNINMGNVVYDFSVDKYDRRGSETPIINLALKMILPVLLSALMYVLAEVISVIEELQQKIDDIRQELRQTSSQRS